MYDIIKDHEKYAWKEGFREGFKEGFREGFLKGWEKGIKKAKERAKKDTYLIFVKRMLDKGFSPELIREYLGLTQKQMDKFFALSVTN